MYVRQAIELRVLLLLLLTVRPVQVMEEKLLFFKGGASEDT